MPSLNAPVLTVDVGLIHKVDIRNVENLFSMWTVFSRCSGSLEEGRRLENLSWRLWNRETFCCDPVSEANATTPAISIASRSSEGRYSTQVPSLSGSIDSLVDEEALEFGSDNTSSSSSAPLHIAYTHIRRQDSVDSRSRGRERHITPDDLEKMVITIKEKKDLKPIALNVQPYFPLLAANIAEPQKINTAASQTAAPAVENKSLSPESVFKPPVQSMSSDSGSGTSERSTTSVVKGFSPSHVSSSYRSIPLLTALSSIPTADIAATTSKGPQPKKHQVFALGGSSGDDSLSEQTNSMEKTFQPTQQKKKNAMFSFGGLSNEEESSLPQKMQKPQSTLTDSIQRPLAQKKQISFKEEVATRTIREEPQYDDDVFEDDSTIDDDDDLSDWEDSIEDSRDDPFDEKIFRPIRLRLNLPSHPSLIATMVTQNGGATSATTSLQSTRALQQPRTFSTKPNTMKKQGLNPIAEVPQTGARPIIHTTTNTTPHQLALSPRTTRRNMLATELTVSLRQNLLWERRHKFQTAHAVLKRGHTAHDVAGLKQYPEKVYMDKEDKDSLNANWNQYFSHGLGEYHSKGW